jgi:N-acetylglucosamine kinase-like BadF-type ATPase
MITETVVHNETELLAWHSRARPGDQAVYHVGNLAKARFEAAKDGEPSAIEELANTVMVLAESGMAIPVQRRVGEGEFAYIAIMPSPSTAVKRSQTRAAAQTRFKSNTMR